MDFEIVYNQKAIKLGLDFEARYIAVDGYGKVLFFAERPEYDVEFKSWEALDGTAMFAYIGQAIVRDDASNLCFMITGDRFDLDAAIASALPIEYPFHVKFFKRNDCYMIDFKPARYKVDECFAVEVSDETGICNKTIISLVDFKMVNLPAPVVYEIESNQIVDLDAIIDELRTKYPMESEE